MYVSSYVYGLYLSRETMVKLQIIPADFPRVGGAQSATFRADKIAANQFVAECG